uniref:Uncharacterized protein n=1 Tax=Peronospora matthiolae TaxID=2874970 RepID=A0AAV1TA23_9STRA
MLLTEVPEGTSEAQSPIRDAFKFSVDLITSANPEAHNFGPM